MERLPRSLRSLFVLIGLLALPSLEAIAAPAPAAPAAVSAAVTPATYSPDAEECAFLGLINAYRADHDLEPLTISRTLGAAAEHHSLDMVENDYFSHTLDDGTTWEENILDFGYPARSTRAENLAAGYGGADRAFAQWQDSPGHNANMLREDFRAIGIGRAAGGRYNWVWTTTFGSVVDAPYSCDGGNPAMALSKTQGKYNGAVDVSASGFAADSDLTLLWDGAPIATGTTDGDGEAMLRFNVPLAVFGEHDLTLRDETGKRAEATYRVIPRILLNEESGPTDTRLRVYFYGFAAGERVEVRWHETDSRYVVLTTLTVADNGRASALIPIPSDTSAGAHKIVGKVIGVSRSASTTFTVTGVVRPELSLSKTSGKYNGLVGVSGSGYTPNGNVTLSWDGTAIASGTADGGGNVQLSFRVPLAVFGNHTVTLRDGGGRSDSATYRVIPRILLNEESGPTDTTLRVYFYGFAAGERVEVRWHQTESTYVVVKTLTVASNGRASAIIEIPRTSSGPHKIVGKVIGVSRSASTTFVVTEVVAAELDEASATPAADATPEPWGTPDAAPEATATPEVTASPAPDEGTPSPVVEEPLPSATATATPEPTEEPAPTSTATATATPGAEGDAPAPPEQSSGA